MEHSVPTSRRWRALIRGVTATTASAGLAGVGGLVTGDSLAAVAGLPGARPDEAVVVVAAGLATLAFAWLALLLAAATCATLPGTLGTLGEVLSWRLAPGWGPRFSAVVLGVVVASSTGVAAQAVPAAPGSSGDRGGAGASIVGFTTVSRVVAPAPDPWAPPVLSTAPEPGWTAPPPPRRQAAQHAALMTTAPRPGWRADDERQEVVVRRGDSLWTIAARHLGARATSTQVAAEWPRWYAANRHLIGDDPALIRPGQVLRAPNDGTGHAHPAENTADGSPGTLRAAS